ncbi:caspase-3-like [Boleophthalmus pectinirostris]|uniref:caspase-3-like n=1 Tax=Boleophthalmus pectinirostris TaxID=150288 RepID=UPI002431F013|nr:caspase-3-like [Boleophthalmus pectinirostris]
MASVDSTKVTMTYHMSSEVRDFLQFWENLNNPEKTPDSDKTKDRKDQTRYRTDFPRVGLCLIINNENFQGEMDTLTGGQLDVNAAKKTFGNLGYEVIVEQNLTVQEMRKQMLKISKLDHSGYASFACVILSHGHQGVVSGIDGIVPFEDLTIYLKGERCPTLLGKPKLFFIDTCQGSKVDRGVDVVDGAEGPTVRRIPVEADFLYAYATAPGYIARINSHTGSWFIQAACKILEEHRDLELLQILTRVNRKVAYDYQQFSEYFGKTYDKQMPCLVSMLTKEFYFPKK